MAKVLLIEDDELIGELLSAILDLDGHTVTWCDNGADGLDLARSESHDIAIVDLLLPSVDGLTVIRRLMESGLDLPAIVISGSASRQVSDRALSLGAKHVLRKPVDADELIEAVRRLAPGSV